MPTIATLPEMESPEPEFKPLTAEEARQFSERNPSLSPAKVVGIQALEGEGFPVTRTLETGSWLARRFHGQGIGTRMRQAVCAFAFDHLGAERITSSAFLDNPASLAVSRNCLASGPRRCTSPTTSSGLQRCRH